MWTQKIENKIESDDFFFQFITTAQNGTVLLQPKHERSSHPEAILFIQTQLQVSAKRYQRSRLS